MKNAGSRGPELSTRQGAFRDCEASPCADINGCKDGLCYPFGRQSTTDGEEKYTYINIYFSSLFMTGYLWQLPRTLLHLGQVTLDDWSLRRTDKRRMIYTVVYPASSLIPPSRNSWGKGVAINLLGSCH